MLALHAYSFESSLTSRSGVGGDPYTLKAFRFTGIDHFYVGRRHGFACKKAGKRWEDIPNGRPFAIIWERGTMTRTCSYIYPIFGLEARHASLSEQAPSIKLARGPIGGPKLEAR